MASNIKQATFALGWFWHPEVSYGKLSGVIDTRVGYTGGTTPDPTYHSMGDHTESIQIDFDPNVISYQALLDHFWASHDPVYKSSCQYKSAIFYHDDEQKRLAEESFAEEEKKRKKKIFTCLQPLETFYLAEDYHQKYLTKARSNCIVS